MSYVSATVSLGQAKVNKKSLPKQTYRYFALSAPQLMRCGGL